MKLFAMVLLSLMSYLPSAAMVQAAELTPLLTTTEIHQAVQNIVHELQHNYLFADQGKSAADKLQAKLAAGDFDGQFDFALFNHEMSSILAQMTSDSGFELIQQSTTTLAEFDHNHNALPGKQHDAFEAGILEHNIGYLKITGNFHYPNSSDLLAEQLRLLAGVDALIIDLRQADEATLTLAQQLISYFVQAETKIANVAFHQGVETLTAGATPGFEKFKQDFPLYIVNSAFVAGSWEFFGYTMQHFDKAVIVGESTMGLGYFSKVVRISDSLLFRFNHASITHPLSNNSWDNHGVVPDYFFQGDAAFNKAYRLALEHIATD